jgi:hypothetical protein
MRSLRGVPTAIRFGCARLFLRDFCVVFSYELVYNFMDGHVAYSLARLIVSLTCLGFLYARCTRIATPAWKIRVISEVSRLLCLCPSPTGWSEIVEITFKNSRYSIIQLVRHLRDIRKHTLKKKQELYQERCPKEMPTERLSSVTTSLS